LPIVASVRQIGFSVFVLEEAIVATTLSVVPSLDFASKEASALLAVGVVGIAFMGWSLARGKARSRAFPALKERSYALTAPFD
jgi:hypothetical protein